MCLIIVAIGEHPEFPLIIAANRDEFFERPARQAEFWNDAPHILAGKDLRRGGTWLGVTRTERFAALTNFRDLSRPIANGPSRGELVRNALDADIDPTSSEQYDGFNLIYGPMDALRYHNNIDGSDLLLSSGIHGLSNHLLDTPWPKVVSAKIAVAAAMDGSTDLLVDRLFSVLGSAERASDSDLPKTGVPLEWERSLSSIFIATNGYGTRCSTVLLVDLHGTVTFEERTHSPVALPAVKFSFKV
ncbi:MAG: NRDE family protein [Flavobacteriales bacterium]|nr:NRDE family protein [Flavobacteriales bacterium]MBK6943287.1 NRDE family protein [Flavobacteriales bacterium]MBK7240835.1 NRDE family protein [Flavobacteriales bacterium]MBK7296555.1 NRDE family protein [Flavobacteriales bacterium]MBK9536182.1 NRDE family protein [Flavobacteriales bacterium]